jgi:hypothetical protein
VSAALTFLANSLWLVTSLPQSCAFRLSARNVERTQRRLLLRLLRRNAQTGYGRRFDFASIRTVAQFQKRAPLTGYDDYQSWIDRIAAGEPGALTAEPVLLLEPTSGSTAATKLIPYTASLKAEFQRAIAAWIVDLFTHDLRLLGGQAYWSVTPVIRRERRTSGGLPIGFEEDSEYLSRWQSALAASVFAVPPSVKLIGEMESFRYVTLLFLLRSRRLALISVWNPTFLTLLVERLEEWGQTLAQDIARGTITAPSLIDDGLLAKLSRMNKPDARRAEEITAALGASGSAGEIHARLWPNLRLISCWKDAHAALYADELARLFPQARVQGKGLLATEGFVSFPLIGREGAALAVRSHFFEFLPVERPDSNRPLLAHELKAGERYAVVITTGGGLYRYQLRDVIEVSGHFGACPLIRFIGKEDQVSDWFGEKLNALNVERAISNALTPHSLTPAFVMLALENEAAQPPAYTLFIEARETPDELLLTLASEIETALWENFHYRYCRELGQLAALRVFRIEGGGGETYLAACQSRGQRAGDIKPAALDKLSGWSRAFRGRFVSPQTES